MFEILKIIGRENELFSNDLIKYEKDIKEIVSSSSFLVIGGAGSIDKQLSGKFSAAILKYCMLLILVKIILSSL